MKGDFVEHLFTATTHDYLMFFTATGRAYVEKSLRNSRVGRAAKGPLDRDISSSSSPMKKLRPRFAFNPKNPERARTLSIKRDENLHIVFATQSGIVKKSNLSNYANVRRGGIIAIQIEEGDRLNRREANEPATTRSSSSRNTG